MPYTRHSEGKLLQRRQRVAQEAARLMAQGGIDDPAHACARAAERLGILDPASLPRPAEIEAALREYQRLFRGPAQALALRQRREGALEAMRFLQGFQPRLVGPVLDGTADATSPVQLQLHVDDADEVARFLDEHGIPAQLRQRRIHLDRARSLQVPCWHLHAGDLPYELVVLPLSSLRQAPLGSADVRPVARASASQLQRLLAQD
jgi:hypothetical protein